MRFAAAIGGSDRVEGETKTPTTPEEQAPVPVEGLGRREMMIVAAALVGSGALMIGMLTVRGTATAASMPARATSQPVAATRVSETTLPPSAGWFENAATWTGNARRGIAYELAARNETQVWMKVVRPVLVVRCVQGRTDAFVFTDSAASMEAQDEDHTVRISFDGEAVRTERWPDSSAHDALFAPEGARFAAELMKAATLRFGYTPHNAAPVVAHFDVTGLSEKIERAPACRGK